MKHLNKYFSGIEIGGVCTGTISYFGLSAKKLLDKGIVAKRDIRLPPEELGHSGIKTNSTSTEHYVFLGFPTDEEQFENPPL